MSDRTVVTLPDRETLMSNLIEVDDNSHAVEQLYPKMCDNLAGHKLVSLGIIMALQLAIHDYVQGLPPVMATLINMQMEQYIIAVTPKEILQETLDHWSQIQQQAQG